MPALKINWVCVYEGESQLYATATRQIALESPPPPGISIDQKHIYFITHHPDTGEIVAHELPREEVLDAALRAPKKNEAIESYEK